MFDNVETQRFKIVVSESHSIEKIQRSFVEDSSRKIHQKITFCR